MDSDSEFTVVRGRRLKREFRRTSTTSETTAAKTTAQKVFMFGYAPVKKSDNVNMVNRQNVTEVFGRVADKNVKETRSNARMNVLMVDATTDGIVDTLKAITGLRNIQVRSFSANWKETTTDIISGVGLEINDSDLVQLLSSTVRILDIQRIGRSRCVKVVFQCDSLPASVKITPPREGCSVRSAGVLETPLADVDNLAVYPAPMIASQTGATIGATSASADTGGTITTSSAGRHCSWNRTRR
ncbi:hypothetical protein HPB48_016511 [Haemaphysalis longicornis]|uniref:Uncharacterized protein n=1 Tax=Haemaphysalis longicornis TaxID=44386 RepID=A0A9J6H4R4_HAELO|nr:hypothetical protein HPB48_016511 [Haemaphysalis longicornis]